MGINRYDAYKAIEIMARSLRDSVKGDPEGRAQMALGQYIAGMGFSNVGFRYSTFYGSSIECGSI